MKITNSLKYEIRNDFLKMESKSDFLNLLNKAKFSIYGDKAYPFEEKQLNYYINSSTKPKGKSFYRTFKIPKKSGGFRTICAPNKGLLPFQKSLNLILQSIYIPNKRAFGFLPGKSIADNAKLHIGKNYVYNIDLENFFPSIGAKRVYGRLLVPPFHLGKTDSRKKIANMIKALTTAKVQEYSRDVKKILANLDKEQFAQINDELVFVLPQGAPTSPILSNIICERLDRKLDNLATAFGLTYSRYADDITFSSQHNMVSGQDIYKEGSKFLGDLNALIVEQGFKINQNKVRLQKRGYRQEVTGIIVNEKLNLRRDYVKQLRHWLYIGERYGLKKLGEHFKFHEGKGTSIVNVISGKLEYLKMIKGYENPMYLKLKSRFDDLASLLDVENFKKPEHYEFDDLPMSTRTVISNAEIASVHEEMAVYEKKLKSVVRPAELFFESTSKTVLKDLVDLKKNEQLTIVDLILTDGLDEAMQNWKPNE